MKQIIMILSLALGPFCAAVQAANAQSLGQSIDTQAQLQQTQQDIATTYAQVLASTLTDVQPLIASQTLAGLTADQTRVIHDQVLGWIADHEAPPDTTSLLIGTAESRENFFNLGGLATDWGLSLRYCQDHLLALIDQNSLKSSLSPQDILDATNQLSLAQGNNATLQPGIVTYAGAAARLTLANGDIWQVPNCFNTDYSAIIPNNAVAMYMPAPSYYTVTQRQRRVESGGQACSNDQIGRELITRDATVPVNSRGLVIGPAEYDISTPTAPGQWRVQPGQSTCRAAGRVPIYFTQSCTHVVDGQTYSGRALKRAWQVEVPQHGGTFGYKLTNDAGETGPQFSPDELWTTCTAPTSSAITVTEEPRERVEQLSCRDVDADYPYGTAWQTTKEVVKTYTWNTDTGVVVAPVKNTVTQSVSIEDGGCYRVSTRYPKITSARSCPSGPVPYVISPPPGSDDYGVVVLAKHGLVMDYLKKDGSVVNVYNFWFRSRPFNVGNADTTQNYRSAPYFLDIVSCPKDHDLEAAEGQRADDWLSRLR